MATDFELAVFEQQLEDVLDLPEASRWTLERDDSVPLGLFVTTHPRTEPARLYRARFRWSDLYKAPSLKFIDLQTGSDGVPEAWPRCHGFRPGSLDACLPWTAEGHALHPDWATSGTNAFPKVDAPVQFALMMLQVTLDTTFQGRHA